MKFFKAIMITFVLFTSIVHADEVSKNACANFLPALGENNIALILNGFKRDFKGDEKGQKRMDDILKSVGESISEDTQKRCDAGLYPIMNLDMCYTKCKSETGKKITGDFAWNVSDRNFFTNNCYQTCTGAYIAQDAITRTLRKVQSDSTNCSSNLNIVDTKKSKQIENILLNINPGEEVKGLAK